MKGRGKGLGALGGTMTLVVKEELKKELKEEDEYRKRSGSKKDYNLTTKDVAQMLGVHQKTVYRWRRRWGLPSKKFGRSVRYCEGDVRRWAAQRKEG